MKEISIFLIRVYKKFISDNLARTFGGGCRFTPTCSEFTIEALNKYGFWKGLLMGLKRLSKCHPLGKYGYDPVE